MIESHTLWSLNLELLDFFLFRSVRILLKITLFDTNGWSIVILHRAFHSLPCHDIKKAVICVQNQKALFSDYH